MTLPTGSRVRLVTFQGSPAPTEPPRADEDYWRLIGTCGTVVDDRTPTWSQAPRCLVQFDDPPSRHGLACHNPVPDALWIALSDLEAAGPAPNRRRT